jgi:F-type H+-transporting ATPase subunit delta
VAAEDPSVSGVSGRYATALFELARDEKAIDAVKADLDRFDALLNESADLKRLIRSPVFTAEAQLKALNAVLQRAGISGIAANFLKVLTRNRRLFAVSDVIRAFRALVAKFKGEATADVTVAETLSDRNLDALKTALKSVTGKDVTLNVKVDPSIIGGLVVKLGSRMVDSSLRTKLNSIKHAMRKFPRSSRTRSRISARRLKFPKSDRCCPSAMALPASTASTTSRPARWSSSRTAPGAWRSTWKPTTSVS